MVSLHEDILFQSTAQGTEHHLLMVLGTYNERYGIQTYPSIETLAKHINKTPRYTFTLLTNLETHGHLKIERVKEPWKRPRNFYIELRPWETAAVQSTEQMITDIGAPLDREKEEEIKTSKIAVIKCSLLSPEVEEYPLSKAAVQVERWVRNPDLAGLCLDPTAYAVA